VAFDSPRWELVGIVEMRAENRKRAADHYCLGGGRAFDSLEHVLQSVDAEAHRNVAIDALELGLHRPVEKHIAPTMAQVDGESELPFQAGPADDKGVFMQEHHRKYRIGVHQFSEGALFYRFSHRDRRTANYRYGHSPVRSDTQHTRAGAGERGRAGAARCFSRERAGYS